MRWVSISATADMNLSELEDRSMACYSPWSWKEEDTATQQNLY